LYESVSLGQVGGNFGWNLREGFHCFDADSPTGPPESCPAVGASGESLIDPIFEYAHRDATGEVFRTAIIGGFVYRGSALPAFAGQYVFGDYSSGFESGDGTMFSAREDATGAWSIRELSVAGQANGRINRYLLAFGQDGGGEIYVLTTSELGPVGTTGQVFRLVAP
jgi:hypothetical protein